ncbi:MAG TPA: methyltransferase domain-containing protein [Terriglobales bacterium]|nr:methyltransferase domain-containing protein [Terriglobales bacterium]
MKRVVIPELLDTDAGTPAEVATALSDLRHINQWFGGIGATQSMTAKITQKIGSNSLSLLEVAAGAGYVPQAVSARMQKLGVEVRITLLDRARSHLKNGSGNGPSAVAGDALALPFADGSFDLVSCCLFVHHLEPREVSQFVNESLRVCRTAVIINDIIRDPIHLGLAYLSLPLYRSHLTHHDAPASVRRAYTIPEMHQMLQQTTAARVEIERHPFFRMGGIAWKR